MCCSLCCVVDQLKEKSQGLLKSKSRLLKKSLIIPRSELIAARIATNLLSSTKIALHKIPISNCYGWSDRTTVLFLLQNNKMFKQFVRNRVQKIKHIPSSSGITFQYQKILQVLVVEEAKKLISKTHGQMDQARNLKEKIGQNK